MARQEEENVQLTLGAIAGYLAVGAVLSALVYWRWLSLQPPPPESSPDIDRVTEFASFKTVNRVEDGWIMVLAEDWPGLRDPAAVEKLCTQLDDRLAPMDGQTIDLLRPDGEPLKNCQAGK